MAYNLRISRVKTATSSALSVTIAQKLAVRSNIKNKPHIHSPSPSLSQRRQYGENSKTNMTTGGSTSSSSGGSGNRSQLERGWRKNKKPSASGAKKGSTSTSRCVTVTKL